MDCENLSVLFPVPSRAPDSVTAHNPSSTSLVVNWSQLPKKNFQGQPPLVAISFITLSDADSDSDIMNVNYSTNTTTLTNLTVYIVINVSAISFGGIGSVNMVKA